jgi:hypothetical protein
MVTKIKAANASFGAIVQSAVPKADEVGNTFQIGVYFPFHKEQLQQEKFRSVFEQVSEELCGQKIAFIVDVLAKEEELTLAV